MEDQSASDRASSRRWWKVILIPTLLAALAGFLISYAFPARYTSQSMVLMEGPRIPDAFVQPVFGGDRTQHLSVVQQRVLSPGRLRPMLERLGLAKGNQNVEDAIDNVQQSVTIEPVPDIAQAGAAGKAGQSSSIPGFYVNYTGPTAREAQEVCSELTSMLLEEDLRAKQEQMSGTADFLSGQLAEAKQNIDSLDRKLAAFKSKHRGQLPSDQDDNLKTLMELNSRLEADTQNLNRANRDKAFAESMLAQELATWRKSESASNREILQQQLIDLQSQLINLQTRRTNENSDSTKVRADIAQVSSKLAEINDASAKRSDTGTENKSGAEPQEIRQLQLQVHQYEGLITQSTDDQKKFQQEIAVYQNRTASSPAIEEEYRELARDYDNAQKIYQDDLAKLSTVKMAAQAQQQQLGDQMALLDPASLPDSPDFPNRTLFAGGGLFAGLVFSVGLALRHRYKPATSKTLPAVAWSKG
jgi:uncharacterized protein involved in exopolysaccharide biosynthesis